MMAARNGARKMTPDPGLERQTLDIGPDPPGTPFV